MSIFSIYFTFLVCSASDCSHPKFCNFHNNASRRRCGMQLYGDSERTSLPPSWKVKKEKNVETRNAERVSSVTSSSASPDIPHGLDWFKAGSSGIQLHFQKVAPVLKTLNREVHFFPVNRHQGYIVHKFFISSYIACLAFFIAVVACQHNVCVCGRRGVQQLTFFLQNSVLKP